MKKIIILLGCFLLVIGCASKSPTTTTDFYFKPRIKGRLPAPFLAQPLEVQQLLTTTVNKRSMTMMTMFNANNTGMELLALTPVGIKLFQINYTEAGIDVKRFVTVGKLPEASQILADIMLAAFPISAWRDHLPQHWQLVDINEGERQLLDQKGRLVMIITYEDKNGRRLPITIQQNVFKYKISLTNL